MNCQDRYHIGPRQFPRPNPGEMSLKRMLTVYLYPTVLNVKPVYMNQQWSFSICTPSVKTNIWQFHRDYKMSLVVNADNLNTDDFKTK